jgi:hypothetical protein
MAYTTGVTNFDPNLNEIVEEAFERCGRELRSGYDLRTARRSLNLLLSEWSNRGINLWTMEQGAIQLYANQITYPIPINTVDLVETIIRTGTGTNQVDINISRISVSTYSTIPNKLATGRPIQIYIDRQGGQTYVFTGTLAASISSTATSIPMSSLAGVPYAGYANIGSETVYYYGTSTQAENVATGASAYATLDNVIRAQNNTTAASHSSGSTVSNTKFPNVTVWPAPDQGSISDPYYTLIYWRMRRLQDAGNGVNVEDIPYRFQEALIAGLAYKLSMKVEGGLDRMGMLKAQYDEAWQLAADEDREKAPLRLVPRQGFLGSGGF